MTRIRRAGRAVAALAVVVCCAVAARAQEVLDQVPSDALVVVKVNNLDTANKKAGAWAEAMGLAQVSPEAGDPLGSMEANLGIKGIDRGGDAAFVFVDPKLVGDNEDKAFILLVPTKDFKTFAASLPNAKTKGNITTFRAENEEEDGYAAQWGNFAALSGSQELLAKKGTGLKVTGLAAKELAEKDVVLYANVPAMRQRLLPELKKQREEVRKQFEQARAKSGGGASPGKSGATPPKPNSGARRPGARPAGESTPPAGNRGATGTTPRRGTPAPTQEQADENEDSATDSDTGAVNGFGFTVSAQDQPRRQQPGQQPQRQQPQRQQPQRQQPARQQPARRPAPPPPPPAEEPEADAEAEMEEGDGDGEMPEIPDVMAEYAPAMAAVADQWFAVAERFLTDANAATLSLNLTDEGINGAATAEFSPGSYMGKIAKGLRNGEGNFTAGLPDRKYFAYGGIQVTPDVMTQLITDMTEPVLKQLEGTGQGGKDTAAIINALKTIVGNSKSVAFGNTVPTGALGADSIIQSVTVVNGNAKQIGGASRTLLKTLGERLEANAKKAIAEAGEDAPKADVSFDFTEGGRAAGGLKLDEARLNVEMDTENNPQAAQFQQMTATVFGPNGMRTALGPVNETSFVLVQGGTDKLVADAVASAQKPQERLGNLAQVKAVTGQLPKNKVAVLYIALDQMITSGVSYAQGLGAPVKVKLPQNLPPIGASVSSEGTALRADWHVPTSLVQSLVAAGMQQYMELQGGQAEPADGL